MSEQFKVGDTVRLTAFARAELSRLEAIFGGNTLRVCPHDVTGHGPDIVSITGLLGGRVESCHRDYLELADPRDEKALLLARVAEIDKSLDEAVASDGLSQLQAIVSETGYFRSMDAFYRYRESGGIREDDMIANYYHVSIVEGYGFSSYGPGDVEASREEVCCCFPSDLEGWQSITMERFLRAKSDYEDIVQKVKEAMEP